MQNQMIQMLMNQLKAKNPQMFQVIEQARQNQNNPKELLKQITKDYTPEQKENFKKFASGFGITEEQLNDINT